MKTYSYACKDFPGMEACPAHFTCETHDELMDVTKLHAKLAHGEDVSQWSQEDLDTVEAAIRIEEV